MYQLTCRFFICCLAVMAWPASAGMAHAADGATAETDHVRERLLLDQGWRFALGNANDPSRDFGYGAERNLAKVAHDQGPGITGDASAFWPIVDLPHDWAVDLPFVKNLNNSGQMAGYKPIGRDFPENSIGWYVRTFALPTSDASRHLSITFDGVFRDCHVWLNGHILGRNESGYVPFSFDISACANYGGRNVLTVRVDATMHEGWFYEGAGIYRHVWLVKSDPMHVAQDGIVITSEVHDTAADVSVSTDLVNDGATDQTIMVVSRILDEDGRTIATQRDAAVAIPAGDTRTTIQHLAVSEPRLWSIETPHLYRLDTTLYSGPTLIDHQTTPFGIRTIHWDAQQGFLLNGVRVEIRGTCNHQDHAGVGVAVPDRINTFRIERLKQMGCNAYRCAHNPPTPELLDACDRLGMLVMCENRQPGATATYLDQLGRMIKRDRNHPSVVIWSLANEEAIQGSDQGARIFSTMKALVRRLDPTRPVTAAMNGALGKGFGAVSDVQGCNYSACNDLDAFHLQHPEQPVFGSEEASSYSTRGIYADDKGHLNAYNTEHPFWGLSPQQWWTRFHPKTWLAGAFVWTGFDYRGESMPTYWPAISSQFGIVDTCGFPKDSFYYYQSWWTTRPVLHLLPHWTWPGRDGWDIRVLCYSNCQEVELLLNGASLGRKPMPRDGSLEWMVKYHPGILIAKGFTANAPVVVEEIATTGPAAALQLTADRSVIHADGEDVSIITVSGEDDHHRFVPDANQLVTFTLSGKGRIIGVGNGDPACHEADHLAQQPHEWSVVNWHMQAVDDGVDHPEVQSDFDDRMWVVANVDEPCISQEKSCTVLRGTLQAPDSLLRSSQITLHVGSLIDNGTVYVNGQALSARSQTTAAWSYDATSALRPGRNVIALVIKNGSNRGGVSHGVWFEGDATVPPTYSRSLFSGLAQVLVQAGTNAGAVTLTAHAPGLKDAAITISLEKAPIRLLAP